MMVVDNMGFVFKIVGVNKSEICQRVEEVVKIFDFE